MSWYLGWSSYEPCARCGRTVNGGAPIGHWYRVVDSFGHPAGMLHKHCDTEADVWPALFRIL